MKKKTFEELEKKIEEALIEPEIKKELIAPLEFSHGLHPTQEEFNEVVAKLNEVIKKVN